MMESQTAHIFAERNPTANRNTSSGDSGRSPGAARVVYDIAHPQPWGWIPALYLWTKSIAAGVLILVGVLASVRVVASGSPGQLLGLAGPALAVIFLAITTVLLIADLKRWDRFYYILIKSNPRSWLVWGTWILISASAIAALWLVLGVLNQKIPPFLQWLGPPLGLASACYSAFLFAQAKGRDLWQSPLFLWHLAVQAVTAGAAALLLLGLALNEEPAIANILTWTIIFAAGAHALMMLGEIALPSMNEDVHHAIRVMTHGALGTVFWLAALTCGSIIPLFLLILALTHAGPLVAMESLAALGVLFGLLAYEYVWITAGQASPLS